MLKPLMPIPQVVRINKKIFHVVETALILALGASTSVAQMVPSKLANSPLATRLSAVPGSTVVEVAVWLNPHNKAEMDSLAHDLYDPKSSSYRRFLPVSEVAARFGPTERELNVVKSSLAAKNLKIVAVGPNNFYVRASGTVDTINKAFHTELHNFVTKGKTFRGPLYEPRLDGEAATLAMGISGLSSLEYSHPLITRKNSSLPGTLPAPPSSVGFQSLASAGGAGPSSGDFFTSNCFTGPETNTYTYGGLLPYATYKGNSYAKGSVPGCGYTPQDIQTAYNLTGLYKEGLDGSGQTIAIVDWCGSPTVKSDSNAFSARFNLPLLTSANFQIIRTPTANPVPACSSPNGEINLDVQWAHAVAPGAAINLMVPPSATFEDTDEAIFYTLNYGLGTVISNSYGADEVLVAYYDPAELVKMAFINELGAVLGVSVNFSSGDSGDGSDPVDGIPPTVQVPASTPYSTAVGGASLALSTAKKVLWQTGWGTNLNYIVDPINGPYVPPNNSAFYGGSGGGTSGVYAKPLYQSALNGDYRQVPDISWLADPYTPAVIAISIPGGYPTLQYTIVGGTSLACPMFSALWAIANQAAGFPLGQAAPYVYGMPASTITDIKPFSSLTNVVGKIEDTDGTTKTYSAAYLAAPLYNATKFYSAIFDIPLNDNTTYIVTFGTDSSLTVTAGWDNVTGVGVPNPKSFVDFFKP